MAKTTCADRVARLTSLEAEGKRHPIVLSKQRTITNLKDALRKDGVDCSHPRRGQLALVADNIKAVERYLNACKAAAKHPGWTVQPHVKKPIEEIGITTDYRTLARMAASVKRTRNSAKSNRSRKHRRVHPRKNSAGVHNGKPMTAADREFQDSYPEAFECYAAPSEMERLIQEHPEYKDTIVANMAPTS